MSDLSKEAKIQIEIFLYKKLIPTAVIIGLIGGAIGFFIKNIATQKAINDAIGKVQPTIIELTQKISTAAAEAESAKTGINNELDKLKNLTSEVEEDTIKKVADKFKDSEEFKTSIKKDFKNELSDLKKDLENELSTLKKSLKEIPDLNPVNKNINSIETSIQSIKNKIKKLETDSIATTGKLGQLEKDNKSLQERITGLTKEKELKFIVDTKEGGDFFVRLIFFNKYDQTDPMKNEFKSGVIDEFVFLGLEGKKEIVRKVTDVSFKKALFARIVNTAPSEWRGSIKILLDGENVLNLPLKSQGKGVYMHYSWDYDFKT